MPAVATDRFARLIESNIAAGQTLAAECYRDPDYFQLELERVLRPGWHAVARWDDLPNPGDYRSVDLCGEPLLVVRGNDRQLRVFSRICAHRAHPVVEGSGNTKRFVCPYHRWSYDLDGRLAAAPLMEDTPGFSRENCGLPELRTDTWQGFTLVSLDPAAEPIAGQLKALDEFLEPHGFAAMETVGTLDFDSPWNWKVLVDNFCESYHHLGPHVESLHKTNPAGGTYPIEGLDGPFALLENPGTQGNPDFYVGLVFPTLLFAVFRGNPIGTWYEMQIDRHDSFRLRIHMLAAPGVIGEDDVDGMKAIFTEVHVEDIGVCDAVQAGLQSRLWQPGPLARPYEGVLGRFHRYLLERLTG
ncbi:MAG: aromatic ring-hydroxylating dioxygenase subunit alpha [Deltaproteobacteria bacterium]|nr:aromatic ring-hydroxylating dioxygenase subunit alpha [Deltaproteobacteria bacterium]MBW2416523.1 aromatic ring-hydroxylating dioxygenase subunit alpha [Deltaproteobacteria bacterium]